MKSKEYWVLSKASISERIQYASSKEEVEREGYPIQARINDDDTTMELRGFRYFVYGEGCKYEVIIKEINNKCDYCIRIGIQGATEVGEDITTVAFGLNGKINIAKIPSYIVKRILDAIRKFDLIQSAELAKRYTKDSKTELPK